MNNLIKTKSNLSQILRVAQSGEYYYPTKNGSTLVIMITYSKNSLTKKPKYYLRIYNKTTGEYEILRKVKIREYYELIFNTKGDIIIFLKKFLKNK